MLLGWLAAGAAVRVTPLSKEYGFEQYVETYADRFIALFAIDSSNRLHVLTTGADLTPEAGWKLISLVKPAP